MNALLGLWLMPFFACAGAAAQGDLVIVADGQARAEIVIAQRSPGPLEFAAQELRRYVRAMSGAELPVVNAPSGAAALFITADVVKPIEKAGEHLSPASEDRYRLDVEAAKIRIHGASPRAALFATYDLLERLGCGWCVPGDDTVPHRSTLALAPLSIEVTPAFSFRALVDFPLVSTAQSIALIDWLAKNRMNWYHPAENAKGEPVKWYAWRDRLVPEVGKRGLHLNFGGHTMHTWMPPERFAQHPEWFRYKDDIRKAPTLCVTNLEMTAELVRNMQRFLDRCPEVEVIDLWHPDDSAFCYCPKCTRGTIPSEARGQIPASIPMDSVRAAYNISYIEFINRVAAAISRSHPRVYVQPLIYGGTDHAMPDGCPPLADNVLVGMAHIERDTYRPLSGEPKSAANMRYLGNDITWAARSRHTYIYEYYNCWVAPFVFPGSKTVVGDLRILHAAGVQGVSTDLYGYSPCNMYVAARALWSPGIAWDVRVRDYYTRHFEEAAQEMAESRIRLENAIDGARGNGSGNAHEVDAAKRTAAGQVLRDARPGQIQFLEGLIARTRNPQVKGRLQREIVAWKLWEKEEARWWALPRFESSP